jgi:predicted transposase YbfD/YdcC
MEMVLMPPEERERFDQHLDQEHYLGSGPLVGKQLRYVAKYRGTWLALLTWSDPAFHLKDREAWIGWKLVQKRRRLPLVVNNSRFLILKTTRLPNVGSRAMTLCLERLASDWEQTYGHAVLVAESFVDTQLFWGSSYRASGWTLLGQTNGYGRARQDYYVAHERPKQLWVRELRPGARTILRGRNLPEALAKSAALHPAECRKSPEQLKRMNGFFGGLPDWRHRQSDYSVSGLVTLCVCAMLSQVCLGQRDLAAFARDLTPQQMAALDFPRRGNPRRYLTPSETTFFRLLSQLNSQALQQALLAWQNHVLGLRASEDDLVAMDGKKLKHSQGVEIVSLYAVKSGRWLGSELVAKGSNEIPALQAALRQSSLEGTLVVADALNTQIQTALIIVQEKGADYLLTVKGNQKGVADNVQQLQKGLQHAFSPQSERPVVQTVERNRGRIEARCLIPFAATAEQVCFPGVQQAARLTRCIDNDEKPAEEIETEWLISSLPSDQLDAAQMLQADRRYWGIENPFHYRLDVVAREDDSRVRTPTSALNLGMMRRAVQSMASRWIGCCHNKRDATLSGFFNFMAGKNSQKAFSLVTACNSSWLPP